MSKIIKIGQLFLNLQPIIWVDVFFETRCIYRYTPVATPRITVTPSHTAFQLSRSARIDQIIAFDSSASG